MITTNRKKDIAVIGMSGVFPKSENLSVFWDNLIKGKELTHQYSDEEADPGLKGKPNYIPVGSFIDQAESFDYRFFGYTNEEAALMDPQTRVMHEQVYAALDNAGYAHQIEENNIGLYLAASNNLNWRLLEMIYAKGKVAKFLAGKLSNQQFISTLISYKLGLKGPSFYTDTSCSSSLTSLHLACRSLLLKECNIAISGGVNINSTDSRGYVFEEGLINSNDGHCRAFDEKASGTFWGEGAGAVVLKRFEDAVRDKDYIYAVVKSTAVNNDGKRKVGYTAPSVEGQSECIKMAHKIAGVQPESISYIEAHGTGTRLGDPIEVEALNKAFNYNTSHKCAVGSVKTNMGHLDAAAGIAGFIKTCLSLNFKMIPPSLHFKNPNPEINFKGGPFYINASLKKWDSNTIRRAGVSSFGIGGTNCHAVLEEFIPVAVSQKQRPHHLLTFSSKTESALDSYKSKVASFFERNKNINYSQLSYNINNKTQHFPYRDFIVFENHQDALTQLNSTEGQGGAQSYNHVIFMFPGQGTQYFEMAKDLYLELPFFKKIMDSGFKRLQDLSGVNYKKVIGYEKQKEEEALLINDTLYTQPLLFLVEYAMAKTLIHFGVNPTGMIGHSLGEYTAACISNVFSLEDGLEIIFNRASLMEKMKPGSMIAIKAEAEDVLGLIENNLSVATINTPNTCVLTGESEYVETLSAKLDEKEISYSILKTSHAFHSYMMDDMLKPFEEVLKKLHFSKPEIPFISNLTGKILTQEDLSASYWAKHLRNTVLFQKGLELLLDKYPSNDSIFIEVGPGKTLLNFLKQQSAKPVLGLSMMRSAKEQKNDFKYLLNNLGVLWKAGEKINGADLYEEDIQKIPVPSYAFDKTELPARINSLKFIQEALNTDKGITSLFYNISTDTLFKGKETDPSIVKEGQANGIRMNLTTKYLPPENKIQMKLCSIWQSFLGTDKIGIEDDFFELGGDSLKAMSILNTIKKEFDCEINIQELYDSPTIKTVSSKIELINKLKSVSKKVPQKNTFKI